MNPRIVGLEASPQPEQWSVVVKTNCHPVHGGKGSNATNLRPRSWPITTPSWKQHPFGEEAWALPPAGWALSNSSGQTSLGEGLSICTGFIPVAMTTLHRGPLSKWGRGELTFTHCRLVHLTSESLLCSGCHWKLPQETQTSPCSAHSPGSLSEPPTNQPSHEPPSTNQCRSLPPAPSPAGQGAHSSVHREGLSPRCPRGRPWRGSECSHSPFRAGPAGCAEASVNQTQAFLSSHMDIRSFHKGLSLGEGGRAMQQELLWDPNLLDLPEPNLTNGWLRNQLGSKAGCCP